MGTFIDGIYRSRAGLAFNDLTDIDRIEILRGPQGTLFGKNTVAGAVNIITRKPEFENSASLTVGVGNLDSQEYGFVGNAVLWPTTCWPGASPTAIRKRDGFYEDYRFGRRLGQPRPAQRARAAACGRRTTDVEVRFIGDYTEEGRVLLPGRILDTPARPVR